MSGGFLQAADWATDGNWSSAAKPVVNDDAIIANTLGADVIDTGGTAEGIDLDLLATHPLYRRNFGSSAAPIQTAADLIQVLGAGGFFFECDAGGVALKTDRIDVMPSNANATIELGTNAGDQGDIDKIVIMGGNVTLKANIMFGATAVVEIGSMGRPSDTRVNIASGADTLASLKMNSGDLTCQGAVTAGELWGGRWVQSDAAVTTLDIHGGVCEWKHATASGSTIIVHPGGTLDLMQQAAYTVIDLVILYPGGKIYRNVGLHTFTSFLDYSGQVRAS